MLKKIAKYLPPCVECLQMMRNFQNIDESVTNCEKCVNWNFLSNSDLLNYEAPKNYPSNSNVMSLRPIKITFQILKNCINVASQNLINGSWTENNVIAYCGVNGINLASSKKLNERVQNRIAIDYINNEDQQSSELKIIEAFRDVKNDFMAHKDKFNLWKGGAYWNSNSKLDHFVDVIMHLIFLGITKATRNLIQKWIGIALKPNQFNLSMKNLFPPIANMGLDWCKLIDTDAGWVSDNYLAFARIMKWYYYPLLQIIYKDVSKKNSNCKPCGVEVIHEAIGGLLAVIKCVMNRVISVKSTPLILERYIKIFLSAIDRIDQSLKIVHTKDKIAPNTTEYVPYWLLKYNYLSMLNLPDTMREYGPLINLWEGSNQGEGYLRYAKPTIVNIHSKNWQVNAIRNLQNKQSLDAIVDYYMQHACIDEDVKNSYGSFRRDRVPKMYVTYKTINEFFTVLRRNLPFSCIRTDKKEYYIVIRVERETTNKVMQGIPIQFDYEGKYNSLSMNFHKVLVDETITDFSLKTFAVSDINKFMLALPHIGTSGYQVNNQSYLYYIIDSEWNELNENNEIKAPTTPRCTY